MSKAWVDEKKENQIILLKMLELNLTVNAKRAQNCYFGKKLKEVN